MKILTTLIVLLICVQAQETKAFNKYSFVRTTPILTEVVMGSVAEAFWQAAAAMYALEWVLTTRTEPLENFSGGVWNYNLIETTHINYPTWIYPTRDLEKITSYHADPIAKTANWAIRTKFKVTLQDGTSTETITYSVTAPPVPDFEKCKIVLARKPNPLIVNDSNFEYLASGTTMFYLMRNGAAAWVRPIRVTTTGFTWIASLGAGDLVRKLLQNNYETSQYVLQPPLAYSVWAPDTSNCPPGQCIEWNEVVIATAF